MNPEVAAFIEALDDDKRRALRQLHEMVVADYPSIEDYISYGIPSYKLGKKRLYLGVWKGGVTVHALRPKNIAEFKKRHPKTKSNKASLNLRTDQPIPLEDIREVIRAALG